MGWHTPKKLASPIIEELAEWKPKTIGKPN